MKCTERNCQMQIGAVDPAHCLADKCPYITKPLNNADRIRAMSDEELAEWLTALEIKAYSRVGYFGNEERFKAQYVEWLKSPAEEAEE